MRVSLLCNNSEHPVVPYLQAWMERAGTDHAAELVTNIRDASGGDILFLISCSEKVLKKDRDKYRKTLVLHASDLPDGRGWSPHVWDVLEGADHITLSMIEAEDVIDTGKIWKKLKIEIPGHALWDEINHALFNAEVELVDFAVTAIDSMMPQDQPASGSPTYRRRRTPDDSRVDPECSIADQFDLIRVCDPDRFPAYFDHLGHRYKLRLEKIDE